MNSSVAIAEIASRTAVWLAVIGAGVKLASGLLPRVQVTNPRGRAGQPAGSVQPGALDGQAARETT